MAEETQKLNEGGAGAKTLGLERYVQFAFVVIAIASFWIFDRAIVLVWNYIAEPNEALASAVAAAAGMIVAIALYKSQRTSAFAMEVAVELAKVTWPNRRETRIATVVVIIASLIAAAVLGLMDGAWSAATDFIFTRGWTGG